MCSACGNPGHRDFPSGERFHDCHVTGIRELFSARDCGLCQERTKTYKAGEVLPGVKLVCAWHKEHFGVDLVMREAAPGFEGEGVSHGICKECLAVSMADAVFGKRK
jgi:hypothetical protein